jgi:hypothetical protein
MKFRPYQLVSLVVAIYLLYLLLPSILNPPDIHAFFSGGGISEAVAQNPTLLNNVCNVSSIPVQECTYASLQADGRLLSGGATNELAILSAYCGMFFLFFFGSLLFYDYSSYGRGGMAYATFFNPSSIAVRAGSDSPWATLLPAAIVSLIVACLYVFVLAFLSTLWGAAIWFVGMPLLLSALAFVFEAFYLLWKYEGDIGGDLAEMLSGKKDFIRLYVALPLAFLIISAILLFEPLPVLNYLPPLLLAGFVIYEQVCLQSPAENAGTPASPST